MTSFDEPAMSQGSPLVRSRPPPLANSREEVWAIVRAAVEEAVIPLVQRVRDLEVRLERAEQIARERPKPTAPPARPAAGPDLASLARTDLGALDIEGYDGGRRKKKLAKWVVGALFAGVLIAIVASVASQS